MKRYCLIILTVLVSLSVFSFAFADENLDTLMNLLNRQISENEALYARIAELEEELSQCKIQVEQNGITRPDQSGSTVNINNGKCENKAEFISDVTISDWTKLSLGENFTKTWRLRNTGTCTWTPNYSVAQIGGFKMSGQSSAYLLRSVAPGETVDVSIDLRAPGYIGGYQTEFKLVDDKGNPFGITGTYTKQEMSFWLKIEVIDESVCSLLSMSPSVINKNTDFDGSFVIRNNSKETWGSGDFDVKISKGTDFLKYDRGYIDLPKSVAPGESITLTYDMISPQDGGNYQFNIQFIRNGSVYCEVYNLIAVR